MKEPRRDSNLETTNQQKVGKFNELDLFERGAGYLNLQATGRKAGRTQNGVAVWHGSAMWGTRGIEQEESGNVQLHREL